VTDYFDANLLKINKFLKKALGTAIHYGIGAVLKANSDKYIY